MDEMRRKGWTPVKAVNGAGDAHRDGIDYLFAHANPNPGRTGCPGPRVLRDLARKKRPIDDPALEHLEQCSPCYREFRELQDRMHSEVTLRRRLAIAAAIGAVVIGGSVWAARPHLVRTPADVTDAVASVDLDLRTALTTRGGERPSSGVAPRLPRREMNLEITLPIGLEPGSYNLRIVDANARAFLTTTATGALRNGAVRVATRADLRSVQSGDYFLAVRRAGADWLLFPVTIE